MAVLNTSTYIYNELKRRKVKVELLDDATALMRYRHQGEWHYLMGCLSEGASLVAARVCRDKKLSERFASQAGLSVPASQLYESEEAAMGFIAEYGPIVVKPTDAAHGHGVSTNVRTKTDLKKALNAVKKYSTKPAMLQQTVEGEDVRLLVIGGRFVAAVRRVPPTVVGDGKHTVAELIERENQQPFRTRGKRGKLAVISLSAAHSFLKRHIGRVPAEGESVVVSGVSNTSLGGHAEDATDEIRAPLRRRAEKLAKLLHLPVCGIDIMMDAEGNYNFLEINAQPGFGPHHHPRAGRRRRVVEPFVDMLLT